MFFLDELDDIRLYKRNILLPLNEKDKKRNSLAYILSPNINSTKDVLSSPTIVNRYYNGFYTERAVLYYVNLENNIDNSESVLFIAEESKVSLYNSPDFPIMFQGYEHYVKEAQKYINEKTIKKLCERYKFNTKKIESINVIINERRQNTDINNIYLVPYTKFPAHFKSYEKFCEFNALMWLFFINNPDMNEWLCMALALKESGVASFYNNKNWPFNYNLGVICRSLDLYETEHGRNEYIREIIKGYNSHYKLQIKISDQLSLLYKDLKRDISPIIFGESFAISEDTGLILEDKKYNAAFKHTLLQPDRIKTNKELLELYKQIKDEFSDIRYTYNEISLYNKLNMFVDLSYYSNAFLTNTTFKNKKAADAYLDLINRLINDKRFIQNGYNVQTVIIPIEGWKKYTNDDGNIHLVAKHINPLSCIYWLLLSNDNLSRLKNIFEDKEILFLGKSSFFKINFSKIEKLQPALFLRNIRKIIKNELVVDLDARQGANAVLSARAIKLNIIDNIEKTQKITINNIETISDKKEEEKTADPKTDQPSKDEKEKEELVKIISKNAENKTNEKDALDSIDNNTDDAEHVKRILSDLSTNPDNRGSNISGARTSRMLKLQNDFLDTEFEGKKISEIINPDSSKREDNIEPVKLDIDSVNPEWKDLTFAATLESYNLDDDIIRIFGSFYDKSNPLVVLSVDKEDTSTSDDLVETYTCKYESANGDRYTLKLDIPKIIDNKYMVLRGNRKNIPIQLFLMPIIKTGEDTVQIVSCYKKIFVRTFGTTSGKSNPVTDKLIKALTKEDYKHIKITTGDNSKVCSKYELPIDYIDLASNFSKIETSTYIFYFNQDEIHKKYDAKESNGLCIGYNKKEKTPIYYKPDPANPKFCSLWIYDLIESSISNSEDREKFINNFNNATTSVRYTYSRASILDSKIPVIVICGLAIGLEPTLQKANIKYSLSEARPKYNKAVQDIIKFKDGYLLYDLNYASCMLMNGLKSCNTEDYSITEINSRVMYLDFLDMFGGRIKADGLDNFQDCMIDPITKDTLAHYNLPTDYVGVLLYSNFLLSDNKYVKHGDIRASRRFRRMEQIASYMYEIISKAYGDYSTGLKHGRKVAFSVKQSAVIDRLLIGNTTDDQSILNALGEYENYNAVTPKGPSGMNSDRTYSLDKRSYDESMLNILSASTGFSGNVGISRQATIDANVEGVRGYIYNDPDSNKNEINSVKTLCMTESLTPFGSTRDDPMRLAMGFVQTSKHGMRCTKSDPLLITSGADEALPYLISNTFVYKSKGKGKVVELVPDKYMIVEYDNIKPPHNHEYINLEETVQKNSSSGFYITLKLDTDLKVGSKVKENQILAYDKQSFSDEMGYDDNIAYNIGTLCKFAILNTDEGYEDSAIVSESLSEAMASDIVLEDTRVLSKDSNIYNLVEKGQEIHEGDTLMIIQNAYDEDDVNTLLRNLNGDEEDITNLGRVAIESKVTGVVQDIIIERTVEMSELSPTLQKVVKKYEKDITDKKNVMKKYGINDENKTLPDLKAMPAIGSLKNATDSVVIKIYLKYHDKFKVGDKLIYGTAVKGVAKDIFPKDKEPYSEYRKNEKIHALLSVGSINARMVTSVLITTAMNKGLIELSRKVKEMAGIPYDDNLV